MQLSPRLLAVSDLVSCTGCLADVGTDHGYIPIYLTETGRITRAVAMDINRGPLERAREHIRQKGLEDRIETRLSDGVMALRPGEAQTVVIAGMGGGLICSILREGRKILSHTQECILQPQSEIEQVRRFLQEEGYSILQEDMVYEDGKYYPMMRVVHGSMELSDVIEFRYGPRLLEKKHPCLASYLDQEEGKWQGVLEKLEEQHTERAAQRIGEVADQLAQIRRAKERMR